MKILFFGDTFGAPGRRAVEFMVPKLIQEHQIDFTIVNGENCAHGHGITPEMAEQFFQVGVNVITTGNHAWDNKLIIPYFSQTTRILRPLNYPDHPLYPTPGRGMTVIERESKKDSKKLQLAVVQVMGRTFMDSIDCPFQSASKAIEKLEALGIQSIVIDFHGEATSEKSAFTHFMDGKVSAVFGTHSHVQTADERISDAGTAAITDVGMTGCFDSVIGVKKELVIQKFLTKRPVKFEPAEGSPGFGAVIIEVEEDSGKALKILRLRQNRIAELA